MDDRVVICNRCGREKIDARYEPLIAAKYDKRGDLPYEQIVAFVPEHAELARQLHNLTCHPADDLQSLLRVLDRAEGELLPVLQTVSLAASDTERTGRSES